MESHFTIFRRIDDGSFISEILHPFLFEKDARMMERARFSIALSSFGWIRFPQKTWNPECRLTLRAWRLFHKLA